MKLKQVTLSTTTHAILLILLLTIMLSGNLAAAPAVTGEPIIVQHIGKLDWPEDDAVSTAVYHTIIRQRH